MPSLISIPAYLLKNTLHRWLENIASPATKVLVPFLFSILGIFFLGVLQQIESQLQEQLNRKELRAVRTYESVRSDAAKIRIANGISEAHLWEEYCESYESFQQLPLLASTDNLRRIPVLTYADPPSFFPVFETPPGEPRAALLLSTQGKVGSMRNVTLLDHDFQLPMARTPEVLEAQLQAPAIAIFPIEKVSTLMGSGYIQVQILIPKKELSSKKLEQIVRIHAEAEGRNIQIDTMQSVIEGINKLLSQQKQARLAIGIIITVILSLILGSLSLLEFRQEGYLIALLRSFGIRPFSLLLHYIFETFFLTFLGIILAIVCYKKAGPILVRKLSDSFEISDLSILGQPSVSDYQALFIAASLGVLISAIPIAFGLRKQPGLLLP